MPTMYINAMTALWNSVGTLYSSIKMNVTNSGSAAGSRLIDLQVGSVDRFYADKDGNVYAAGNITALGTLTAGGALLPSASDTVALGSLAYPWSDLYLGTAGVINYAGDITLTHATDTLTVAGGDLLVTTAGTTATSVATLGATQTLTNKTLTSPVLTSPVLTTPQINNLASTFQYVFTPTAIVADRNVTLPLLTGDDTFVFAAFTQTLTNKTLTSPTINGATLTGTIAGGTHTGASLTSPTITGTPTASGSTWATLGTVTTIDLNGGTIDGAVIGGAAASTGSFTTLNSTGGALNGTIGATTPAAGTFTTLGATTITGTTIVANTAANPDADDGAALGTSLLRWSDLYLAAGGEVNFGLGGVINFNADVAIAHALNTLSFTGGTSYLFDAPIGPTVTNISALGSLGNTWSDLFLGSAGTINFGNDVTLTHATDRLTVAGGDLRVGTSVLPNVNDGAVLGSSVLRWSDIFLAAGAEVNFGLGGIINFNADVAIAHALNTLSFTGGTSYIFDAPLGPTADNTVALGSLGNTWSDLFLGTGAVINFGNDVTLTHATDVLTVAGGTLSAAINGTVGATTPSTGVFTTATVTTATINTTINPDINDGATLGTSLLRWSDLFLAPGAEVNFGLGGIINFNADVAIAHAANTLSFTGGTSYLFDAPLAPTVTNTVALGSVSNTWSDLFLGTGAVINFGADITLTHSADLLTFAGGNYSFTGVVNVTSSLFVQSGGLTVDGGIDAGTGPISCGAFGMGANGVIITSNQVRSSVASAAAFAHQEYWNTNAARVGSIITTGTATAFNTSSDERLKENFRGFDSGAIIDAINAYQFKWKSDGKTAYGVRAQECFEVYPDAIYVGSTGDQEGDATFEPWEADYSKFVPVLLAELKALRARVQALEDFSANKATA